MSVLVAQVSTDSTNRTTDAIDLAAFCKEVEALEPSQRAQVCAEQVMEAIGGIGSLYLEALLKTGQYELTFMAGHYLSSESVPESEIIQEAMNCTGMNSQRSIVALAGIQERLVERLSPVALFGRRPLLTLGPIGDIGPPPDGSDKFIVTVTDSAATRYSHYQVLESAPKLEPVPLATLVHISDLHFARTFTTDETLFKKLLVSIPFVQATCTHSYQVARALAIRVNQIKENRLTAKIPTCIVFTGDLTRGGEEAELTVGETYLRGTQWTGAGDSVGLDLGTPREEITPGSAAALFDVPGNHDIWQRSDPHVAGALRRHFPDKWPSQCRIRTQRQDIFLYGLDSTQNTELHHRLALGRIPPEDLDALCERIRREHQRGSTQAVCLHHPIAELEGDGPLLTMRLENKEQVAAKLYEAGADMVLAGHVHEWFVKERQVGHPALLVTGSGTQQFSRRSFLLVDIYARHLRVTPFEYDDSRSGTLQFLPLIGRQSTLYLHKFSPPDGSFDL